MAQIDRLYKYKSMFARKLKRKKQQFLTEMYVSEATFKRDLVKMRDSYNYQIKYDRFSETYELLNPNDTYELPGLMFSQKELIALVTIQKMIEELEPSLLGPKLEPLQVKLSELLKAEGLDEKELSKRIRAVHAGKRRLELNSFQIIANATLERKRLNIKHFNRGRNEHTVREISPQQLVHYRDNWYVDAWCHKREKLLNFSIDAISECNILSTVALEISQKEIKQAMQSGYGIFGGEAQNWAKLKFTPERARWVKDEMWHPDQKATSHKDGSYTLEIPYSDDRELLGDILLFGPDVEVLGPKQLRDKVALAVRKTLKIYEN